MTTTPALSAAKRTRIDEVYTAKPQVAASESRLTNDSLSRQLKDLIVSFLTSRDHNAFCRTHKAKHKPLADRVKIPLEARKTATTQEIDEYLKATGQPFSSEKITHLVVMSDIRNADLCNLFERLPNLHNIDLYDSLGVTSIEGLKAIVARYPNLHSLSVRINSDEGFTVLKACRELRNLKIKPMQSSDAGFMDLVKELDLHSLTVGGFGTSFITDGLCEAIATCANLESLDMFWGSISDIGLCQIAKGCKKLQSLRASHCEKATDIGIKAVTSSCDLHSLDITRLQGIRDFACKAIANCPNLRRLNIAGCHEVTDDGLRFIAEGCPNLNSLDISFCNITNRGLVSLGSRCKSLNSLNVVGCKVTLADIRGLLEACPKLERISFENALKWRGRAFFYEKGQDPSPADGGV